MKTKTYVALCAAALVLGSCSKEESPVLSPTLESQQDPLTHREIDQKIDGLIAEKGIFEWHMVDDHTLWSALVISDSLLSVGYGKDSGHFSKQADKTASNQIKDDLLSIIDHNQGANDGKSTVSSLVYDDEVLTHMDVKVYGMETISALRGQRGVRFMEPIGYQYGGLEPQVGPHEKSSSGSGCGFESATLHSGDYSTISPGAKVPWAFYIHNIPQAWSHSTGSGIGIGIIDTGISPRQSLLNGNFNDGHSSGRYVRKYGTFVDSWWPWSKKTDGPHDKCGHGTSMAAVATSPRNNDGQPVGVAYNANLISYRAAKNVVLDSYHEQKGTANALVALGKRSDVKIISMSMGHIFSVGRIKDAVRYAHNRGKLIFAAAGTSTSFTNWAGVVFPAWMSETVAVTGVNDRSSYQECNTCHTGSEVDFTVVMQRNGNTARTIPVLSYYNGQKDYVGGSSVATATAAGIAALVWARHPSWSRAQVLQKLKQSSDFYPNKHSRYGHGNIDALQAVQ
ncbi:MAG: S8 family serine peptidase [Flavobacteriaceae bacterium]